MDHACGQDHLLLDYAAGRLSAETRQQVEAHLGGCERCRRETQALRALAQDLSQLERAGRRDLPEASAKALLHQASRALDERRAAAEKTLGQLRRSARQRQRHMLAWRVLIPLAAAAAVILVVQIIPRVAPRPVEPYPAVLDLYAEASGVQTVEGISLLEGSARRAMDEAMAATTPEVARVANLQLIHYITLRAVEPQQIADIHFLLALVQADERAGQQADAARLWDWLATMESRAYAAEVMEDGYPAAVQPLMIAGRYEELYVLLVEDAATRGRPLTAYAAIRAGRLGEARILIDGLTGSEYADPRLVSLLDVELAMVQARFDLAMRHYVDAAESDSRLWFQAAYLCKYELNDDKLAGQLFERTGDDRVAAHVRDRFRSDVAIARRDGNMLAEDFESYPVASLPSNWRLIPTHAGEFEIARVDESNVLKQNELGREGAKLLTGYPGWSDYTLTCDFKVLRRTGEPDVQIVVYDQGLSDYAVGFEGGVAQLFHKVYSGDDSVVMRPAAAQGALPEPIAAGKWWRCRVRVQNLGPHETQVSATLWPREGPQPDQAQILWTDVGTGERPALQRGRVGFRLANAEVAFDNISVTANDMKDGK